MTTKYWHQTNLFHTLLSSLNEYLLCSSLPAFGLLLFLPCVTPLPSYSFLFLQNKEIEPLDFISHMESYVATNCADQMAAVIELLAAKFPAAAHHLDVKWDVASVDVKHLILDNLSSPDFPQLVLPRCNDNARLHAMVPNPEDYLIKNATNWIPARNQISKAFGLCFIPTRSPSVSTMEETGAWKADCVAIFCKRGHLGETTGNLYLIQVS